MNMKAITKARTPGNLVVGDLMDTQMEFEVPYMKIELDGKKRIEMDKYNYIYKVYGVDQLADVLKMKIKLNKSMIAADFEQAMARTKAVAFSGKNKTP